MKKAILVSAFLFSSLAQAQQVIEMPIDYASYEDCQATSREVYLKSKDQKYLDGKTYYKYNGKWVASDFCVDRSIYSYSLQDTGFDAKKIEEMIKAKRNRFYVYTDSEFQQKLAEQRQKEIEYQRNQQSRVNNITAKF